MNNTRSKFFSIMVVGDNPDEIVNKYDLNKTVEPYVKYRYLDAKKYKSTAIKVIEKLLSEGDKIPIKGNVRESLKERLRTLKNMSDFDYYRELTDGMYYDDEGNAMSYENPDGKWRTCRKGEHFSLPLILKNGEETYSARAGDVDWNKMNGANKEVYEAAWEVVVEGRPPVTEDEETIAKVMGDKQNYFSNFKNKEHYVKYSTAYWNYAYVDENGWKDMDDKSDENEWITKFFDKFVRPLKPDDLITIYECSINEDN